MTFKPAHKDTTTPPGQIVNPIPRELTVGGIVDRIMKDEPKKLSFAEWFVKWYAPYTVGKMDVEDIANAAWKAGQENK